METVRDRPIEITPEMVAAAKAALIAWYDGVADFGEGALGILKAGMSAGREPVHIFAGPVRGCDEPA